MFLQNISKFISNYRYEQATVESITTVKAAFLDFFGVTYRGSCEDASNIAFNTVEEIFSGNLNLNMKASVIGKKVKTDILSAAFLNGVAAHVLELDDGHRGAQIHLGAVIFPTALAISQSNDLSGKEFLEGVMVGYEVGILLGKLVNPDHRNKGFHTTGTIGTFIAGAVASKLLKLDEKQIINALGLCGTQAAGLLESDHGGSMGKALHAMGAPLWTPSTPRPHKMQPLQQLPSDKKVVYFPSCLNQALGRSKHGTNVDLVDKVVSFLGKAGWEVIFPHDMSNLCCGMIWNSKGMPDVANEKTKELEEAMLKASNNGEFLVVCDQSPCLHHMREHMERVKPLELMEFIHDHVAQDLEFTPTHEPIALHLTCSTRLMKIDDKMLSLAKRCSTSVLVPEGVGCCGFAGDKGFTHPELNEWALRKLRPQIEEAGISRGFSNSRTCEIGLTTHSGIPYQSLIYLIDECTSLKK